MASYNLWASKKRFLYAYRILTVVSILIGAGRPLIGVIFIKLGSSNLGYMLIYGYALVNICVGTVIYIVNQKKHTKFIAFGYWKYIFKFCVPLIPHFLSIQVLTRFDRIMINKMCSPSDVAIYSLAYSLSMLMQIVSDAVLSALTPWTYQCIKEQNKEKIGNVINVTLFLIAGANLILILFAPEAVKIFAPLEYYQAIYVIPAVSASVYFIYLFNVFANIEYYYSETRFVAFASIAAALLNVVLNFIFIRKYGFIAAGYTTLASYILYAFMHYICMSKVCSIHAEGYSFYDTRFILLVSVAFVALAILALTLYKYAIIRYLIIFTIVILAIWKRKLILSFLKEEYRKKV
jgi:O-antigen/teichoic acid export membrane protein